MNRPPNILWLMTDEERADSLGCYGSAWARTPVLDRLARKGVVFENAISPSPACVPARISIATGTLPHVTGCWHNEWQAETPPAFLTHRFADAGYQTAGFGKMHFNSPTPAFQTQEEIILSKHVAYFDYAAEYDESQFSVVKYPGEKSRWIMGGRFPAPLEETSEHIVATKAIHWLASRDRSRPFLLKVSFNGPHTPVVPPTPFDTMIADGDIPDIDSPFPEGYPEWSRRLVTSGYADASRLSKVERRLMRRYYYGYAAFLDQEFGRVIRELEGENILEDTIIVFTSDHGTHLGDFGMIQKQTFFDPSVRVPFLFHFPRSFAPGRRVHAPVSTTSLLPTLLDVAGISVPDTVAPSLIPSLMQGVEPTTPVLSEFMYTPKHIRGDDRLIMVRDRSWKLSFTSDDHLEHAVLTAADDIGDSRNRLTENKSEVEKLYAVYSEKLDAS